MDSEAPPAKQARIHQQDDMTVEDLSMDIATRAEAESKHADRFASETPGATLESFGFDAAESKALSRDSLHLGQAWVCAAYRFDASR